MVSVAFIFWLLLLLLLYFVYCSKNPSNSQNAKASFLKGLKSLQLVSNLDLRAVILWQANVLNSYTAISVFQFKDKEKK